MGPLLRAGSPEVPTPCTNMIPRTSRALLKRLEEGLRNKVIADGDRRICPSRPCHDGEGRMCPDAMEASPVATSRLCLVADLLLDCTAVTGGRSRRVMDVEQRIFRSIARPAVLPIVGRQPLSHVASFTNINDYAVGTSANQVDSASSSRDIIRLLERAIPGQPRVRSHFLTSWYICATIRTIRHIRQKIKSVNDFLSFPSMSALRSF